MMCYTHLSMTDQTPIDITNIPELVRIAEEVETTKTPRELKWENKTVAVIMPVPKATLTKKQRKTKADYEASLAAIGSWRDLDPDALMAQVYRAREAGSRPATRL